MKFPPMLVALTLYIGMYRDVINENYLYLIMPTLVIFVWYFKDTDLNRIVLFMLPACIRQNETLETLAFYFAVYFFVSMYYMIFKLHENLYSEGTPTKEAPKKIYTNFNDQPSDSTEVTPLNEMGDKCVITETQGFTIEDTS